MTKSKNSTFPSTHFSGNGGLMSLMTWRYWTLIQPERGARGLPFFDLIGSTILINILGLVLPIMMLQIYDRILPNEGTATLSFLAIGVLVAILFDSVLRVSRAYLTAWSGAVHDHALSTYLMEKMFRISYMEFGSKSISERLVQLQSSSKLREFYSGQSFLTLLDVPFAFIFLGAIAYIGGWMVLVPLFGIALIAVVTWFNARKTRELAMETDDLEAVRINAVMQTLKNIQTVKGQAMENILMRSYETNKAVHGRSSFRFGQIQMKGAVFGQAVSTLALIATAGLGALFVMQGVLTIGGVAACVLLCGRAVQPAQKALSLFGRIGATRRALDSVESVVSLPQAKKLILPAATAADTIGQVEIRKLGFSYKKNGPYLFKDLSLSVQPGEAIAIQGDTGSGKSTLLSLIMGLYPPTEGKVTMDGHQSHRIDHTFLSPGVAYLPQKPDLVHGTILENITLFRSETHRQQACHVAQILGLDDVVLRLPHGYNTVIGKGQASLLPDGMIKRIAIARALLDPSRLILFDEADAYLDVDGRARLFKLMKGLIGKCTLIMVSKSPTIFQLTNRCYRLENGKLESAHRGAAFNAANIGSAKSSEEFMKKGTLL